MKQAAGVAAAMKGRVMVNAGAKPYLAVKIPKHGNPIDTIKETLETIRKVSTE